MLVVPQSTVDEQRRAALGERAHRLDIRAVAFEQAVGNVDDRLDAAVAQKARQQRRRGRAVDVVIAENRDALAAHDGVGDARGRLRHGGEHVRIGHRALDGRIEKGVDRIDLDVAAGKNARQQFGKLVPLRDRERPRRAALVEPVAPRAPGRRIFDAEEEAILSMADCALVMLRKASAPALRAANRRSIQSRTIDAAADCWARRATRRRR